MASAKHFYGFPLKEMNTTWNGKIGCLSRHIVCCLWVVVVAIYIVVSIWWRKAESHFKVVFIFCPRGSRGIYHLKCFQVRVVIFMGHWLRLSGRPKKMHRKQNDLSWVAIRRERKINLLFFKEPLPDVYLNICLETSLISQLHIQFSSEALTESETQRIV